MVVVVSGMAVHVYECGGQLWFMCEVFCWLGPLWASVGSCIHTGRKALGKLGVVEAET